MRHSCKPNHLLSLTAACDPLSLWRVPLSPFTLFHSFVRTNEWLSTPHTLSQLGQILKHLLGTSRVSFLSLPLSRSGYPWHIRLCPSFSSSASSLCSFIWVCVFGLSLRRPAWSSWLTRLSGRRQCRRCTTRGRRTTTWMVGRPGVGLCSGMELWSTTFRTVRSRPIESPARLALGGPTTPTTATRPEPQPTLTPEAALGSLAAGDEWGRFGFLMLFCLIYVNGYVWVWFGVGWEC